MNKKCVVLNREGHCQDQSMSQVGRLLQKEAHSAIFVCILAKVVLLMTCSVLGSLSNFLSKSLFAFVFSSTYAGIAAMCANKFYLLKGVCMKGKLRIFIL